MRQASTKDEFGDTGFVDAQPVLCKAVLRSVQMRAFRKLAHGEKCIGDLGEMQTCK